MYGSPHSSIQQIAGWQMAYRKILNILPQHWKIMQILYTQYAYIHIYICAESSLKYLISTTQYAWLCGKLGCSYMLLTKL